MPARATAETVIEGEVTFRGRGLGVIRDRKLHVMICPHCSQRNAGGRVPKASCQWCAYEPSIRDAEPSRQP